MILDVFYLDLLAVLNLRTEIFHEWALGNLNRLRGIHLMRRISVEVIHIIESTSLRESGLSILILIVGIVTSSS